MATRRAAVEQQSRCGSPCAFLLPRLLHPPPGAGPDVMQQQQDILDRVTSVILVKQNSPAETLAAQIRWDGNGPRVTQGRLCMSEPGTTDEAPRATAHRLSGPGLSQEPAAETQPNARSEGLPHPTIWGPRRRWASGVTQLH